MSPDLAAEREFLRRSLADARREHDAGDLSDEDYQLLRQRDQRRLDEVEHTLAEGSPDPAPAPRRPAARRARRRRANGYGIVGAVLLVAGAVVLVLHLTSTRLPGQVATGNLQLNQAQQISEELSQAADLLGAGQQSEAVQLYTAVLGQDPADPQALAQLGWLTYEQGVFDRRPSYVATGRSLLQRALSVDPRFGPAHLYDGVILLEQDHDANGAVAQFERFLQEQPSKQNLANGAPFIRQAFTEVGRPVPAQVPAATPTTGTPTTGTPSTTG